MSGGGFTDLTQKEKYDIIVKKKSAHIIGIYDFHHFEEKICLSERRIP